MRTTSRWTSLLGLALGLTLCAAAFAAPQQASPTPTPAARGARRGGGRGAVPRPTPEGYAQPATPKYNPKEVLDGLKPGTYAVFETNHGIFVSILFTEKAPRTTANFIGLAEGVREFRDPYTLQRVKRPYYDGVIFHRLIRNGLIQTGDPTGTGSAGTGYYFDDEFVPELKHDKIGVMSMATARSVDPPHDGANTNDGQFAIALRLRPDLDMNYSVFGEIVKGVEVAQAIGALPVGPAPGRGERPNASTVTPTPTPTPRPANSTAATSATGRRGRGAGRGRGRGAAAFSYPLPPEPRIETLRIYRINENGSIANSPPPPDIDIKMRWATAADPGPSRVANLANQTTATTANGNGAARGGARRNGGGNQ